MRGRQLFGIAVAGLVVLGLASCTLEGSSDRDTVSSPAAPAPGAGRSSTGASGTGSPASSPAPGPEVTAAASKFDDANAALAARNSDADDRAIVDGLVTAGFDKGSMQVTPDTTSIGRRADSIEVSVLIGSTCLLGQFGGATYVGSTAPVLSTGRCLIGDTRAIDW